MRPATSVAAVLLLALAVAGCKDRDSHHYGNGSTTGATTSGTGSGSVTGVGMGPGVGGGMGSTVGNGGNALLAISPDEGPACGGEVVTLAGTGLVQNGTKVLFDGVEATDVQVTGGNQLTCKTPAHPPGLVDVELVGPNGQSGRLNNAYTFEAVTMARVADMGDPTAEEQELLELMNRARRDPAAEGRRLGLDFSAYKPLGPLVFDAELTKAAVGHTEDMVRRGFYGHTNPDGVGPNGRILDTAYELHPDFGTDRTKNLTENIGVGSGNRFVTPQEVHDLFMVDAGLNPPKHREIILGAVGHFPKNREVGIGYRTNQQSNQVWEHFVTEEFAYSKTDAPFVTGVVFDDASGDGIARAGEGRAGVTVTLSSPGCGFTVTTQTATAGGYGFEVLVPGTYTLTIDGQSTTVDVAGDSVKVDLRDGRVVTY